MHGTYSNIVWQIIFLSPVFSVTLANDISTLQSSYDTNNWVLHLVAADNWRPSRVPLRTTSYMLILLSSLGNIPRTLPDYSYFGIVLLRRCWTFYSFGRSAVCKSLWFMLTLTCKIDAFVWREVRCLCILLFVYNCVWSSSSSTPACCSGPVYHHSQRQPAVLVLFTIILNASLPIWSCLPSSSMPACWAFFSSSIWSCSCIPSSSMPACWAVFSSSICSCSCIPSSSMPACWAVFSSSPGRWLLQIQSDKFDHSYLSLTLGTIIPFSPF